MKSYDLISVELCAVLYGIISCSVVLAASKQITVLSQMT